MGDQVRPPTLSRARLFLKFLRFGALAFGGPVAQIAMIREDLVERERWLSRERFNRTLAVYQALPGPEAHELCVFFGMLVRGRIGGLLAGLGFMLPGFALVLILAEVYVRYGISSTLLAGVLAGFQPAIAALIVRAVARIGRHVLTHPWLWTVAAVAAVGQALEAPFWIALVWGGVSHTLVASRRLALAGTATAVAAAGLWLTAEPSAIAAEPVITAGGDPPALAALLVTGLKAGLLTFGGAYTAIPFVRHDAVVAGRWITDAGFLDSIALSGILPAPLVIFGTFVGYVGGGFDGALMMTVGIFAPAFAFTLVGPRQLERLVHEPRGHAFLDGVAASVVGLITITGIRLLPAAIDDVGTALIFAGALIATIVWKGRWTVLAVMLGAGALGLILDRL